MDQRRRRAVITLAMGALALGAERTVAWARVYAAQYGTSVSRLVGQMPQERMKGDREYESAMRRFLGKKPVKLKRRGQRYARRDELHDRSRLRTGMRWLPGTRHAVGRELGHDRDIVVVLRRRLG